MFDVKKQNAEKMRKNFRNTLDTVEHQKKIVLITRHNRVSAAIVPAELLSMLPKKETP